MKCLQCTFAGLWYWCFQYRSNNDAYDIAVTQWSDDFLRFVLCGWVSGIFQYRTFRLYIFTFVFEQLQIKPQCLGLNCVLGLVPMLLLFLCPFCWSILPSLLFINAAKGKIWNGGVERRKEKEREIWLTTGWLFQYFIYQTQMFPMFCPWLRSLLIRKGLKLTDTTTSNKCCGNSNTQAHTTTDAYAYIM